MKPGREKDESGCTPSGPPVLLTVAGFDPSSGAGMTADLKVFAAYGCFGVSCITALTVQSSQGVREVEAVPGSWTAETLQCLYEDVEVAGVKVGMLATIGNTLALTEFLTRTDLARNRVVLDPVLVSSSGTRLLEPEGIACLRERLLGRVGWITPNLDELAVLSGVPCRAFEDVPTGAARLKEAAAQVGNHDINILVTGGHLEKPDDYLLAADSDAGVWIPGVLVETSATHGTGCALSSALLCELIAGKSPREAVAAAKRYVEESMRRAPKVGQGHGSMHHLHRLEDC